MKILVIGSGGREHAICMKLSKSKRVSRLFCAPGNGGIEKIATCVDIKATDIQGVIAFAQNESIDLVFVAPDDPLAMGMVDRLEAVGIKAFGPRKNAAIIESSKVFSKDLMRKYNIPAAGYEVFDDAQLAKDYIDTQTPPIVVKADGLALGKGVIIAQDRDEAKKAIDSIMVDRKFGDAGNMVVIEEFMVGPEVSLLCFTDSVTIMPMVSSQDHKRAYDNDAGPNTGGMGAFAPSPLMTKELSDKVKSEILIPSMEAMNSENRPFKGVLYVGLMLTQDGVKVLEYNARFGDPEAQVVLPLLQTDLLDIIEAIDTEKLSELDIEWSEMAAAGVVMASGGYPIKYEKGYVISGIDDIDSDIIQVYHAGTKSIGGKIVTNGGRVLCVSALGSTLKEAIDASYEVVGKIDFQDAHYRKDIGRK